MENNNTGYCISCRKETIFNFIKTDILKNIRGKDYSFSVTSAVCSECGTEMNPPGLTDRNILEVDRQYRNYENLVSIGDIEKLMNLYNIGKAPLSLVLGFGEITVTRYLDGQIPSKEYSEVIKDVLSSPSVMKKYLIRNKNKISPVAFNKAMESINNVNRIFCLSEKMLKSISFIFKNLVEVTPLALQKLLYFSQGFSFALNRKQLFEEDCEAWLHGPVYPEVYKIFRDFKYNPIDDERFAVLEGIKTELSDEEMNVLALVCGTFGLYGGKVLEEITHKENPWSAAMKSSVKEDFMENNIISKESIKNYFCSEGEKYDFSHPEEIKRYIDFTLKN